MKWSAQTSAHTTTEGLFCGFSRLFLSLLLCVFAALREISLLLTSASALRSDHAQNQIDDKGVLKYAKSSN
jgi:hypothetical protein